MRILFFGTPSFAVPTFEALKDNIVMVVTQPDRPAGRGHKLKAPPIKELALKYGIEVVQPQNLKDKEFIERLFSTSFDLGVVVAYGRIIPGEILKRLQCINLHGSLLPKYRGAAPVQWAIINGEKVTGVTTMLMDEGLDTGPILMQQEVEIKDDDNAETLSKRLSEIGAQLMVKTIQGLQEGTVVPKPQEGQPSYAPIIKKTDGLIDWNLPASRIHNLVRGLYPWPTAYTCIDGKLLKILKTKVLEGRGPAGEVVKRTPKELIIGTPEGLLQILELQVEGRKPQVIEAFLQGAGRNIKEGTRLG